MKTMVLVVRALLCLLLFANGLAVAQPTTPNLLINGDFEDRNNAPQGRVNIGPVDSNHLYDDLKNWRHINSINNYEDSPDYIASDGALGVNPTTDIPSYGYPGYGGFTAHSGISCVQIGRAAAPTVVYDEFVAQELSQPLTPGHTYHAEFWTLRQPGGSWRTKLAFHIINSAQVPTFDAAQNALLPSPGNKVFFSDDIQQRYTWTKVSGDIDIPALQSGQSNDNRWVVIGFERPQPTYDRTAISDPFGDIFFAIDDVSLVDIGCTPIPYPLVTQENPENWRNYNQASFSIDNRVPGANYIINNIQFANPTAQPGTIRSSFIVKGGYPTPGPIYYGYFTITASNACGSITTDPIPVEYRIGNPEDARTASTINAYPNPATESITIPEGVEGAALINDKGKVLRKANTSGRLDVQSLPDGLYNLQMMRDGKLINQRIQVKH